MDIRDLSLIGGHTALDFANTVWWHEAEEPVEWLRSYDDLLHWALRAGVLDEAAAGELRELSSAAPGYAGRIVARAVRLREALFRLFGAVTRDRETDPGDLEILNQELAEALPHLALGCAGDIFVWTWQGRHLDRPLWPVTWEASRLLVSPELERVRICAGSPCGWLFLDRSRNRSRRWCDMADCGNRAKVRRHYRRHKKKGPSV